MVVSISVFLSWPVREFIHRFPEGRLFKMKLQNVSRVRVRVRVRAWRLGEGVCGTDSIV